MRALLSLVLAFCLSVSVLVLRQGGVAEAGFHCMRLHAVMGGYNGDGNVQYVELRMDAAGQPFVGGHTIEFFNFAGALRARFTFPSDVTNSTKGESVLIATSEFNSNVTGGAADYVFSAANTAAFGGGDALHPVQGANGVVVFASTFGGCTAAIPVDSVAYGTGPATYGSPAAALPSPGNLQSLRLNNLATAPSNNSTEYSLQNVSTTTFAVTAPNLATDFSTPRNNGRTVLKLNAPYTGPVGGVAEQPALGSLPSARTASDNVRTTEYVIAGVLAAVAVTFGAGWYAYRRRVTQRA